jgi:hypothetical protein
VSVDGGAGTHSAVGQRMRDHPAYVLTFIACASLLLVGCDAPDGGADDRDTWDDGGGGSDISGPACWLMDFDTDGAGAPIVAGQVVEKAYQTRGVSLAVHNVKGGKRGLGVAFDAANPTGEDDDLGFPDQGNVLINQENFTKREREAGKVDEPDDQACGARFEFCFASPVCVAGLTVLDIDDDEKPTVIELFDADDNRILRHEVPPTGNHQRVSVALPAQAECAAVRMVVTLSGSGAIDDIQLCDREQEEEVRWTRTIDTGASETATSIDVDGDGHVAVGGFVDDLGDADGLVTVYDAEGAVLWTRTADAGNADIIDGIASGEDGSVVAVGATGDAGGEDLWVRKYDAEGNELWTQTFDSGDVETALDADIGPDGEVAVTGVIMGPSGSDVFLRLYDADGNTLWTQRIDNGSQDQGRGVAIGADGRVAVAGQVDGGGDLDAWVRVYDGAGVEIWQDVFDSSAFDSANGVAIDAAGNVVIAGTRLGDDFDAFVRSYTPEGDARWTRTFDSEVGDDAARAVAVDSEGNAIVHGQIGTGGVDVWTQTYSIDGVEVTTRLFDNGGAEVGTGVAVGPDDRIAVCGFIEGIGGLDGWVRVFNR